MLARLTDLDAPLSSLSLTDRLGHWLDWKQSLALSTALDGAPRSGDADATAAAFGDADEAEYIRVRTALVHAIPAVADPTVLGQVATEATIEYTVFRQRYVVMQRKMYASTTTLRSRLRDMLAHASPQAARLAGLDAAMEQSLSAREQALFSSVPGLLGERFERLRQAEPLANSWLDAFRAELQALLLAELDVRFQPVEGLLAALRACSLESHAQKPA